ncbi:MAG TPA: glycosyl hydrolase family 28-related protein [Terriglobia bacterium]|nr:glycosyl hydrolase family 28-related protein [Terriglobia bacterium]
MTASGIAGFKDFGGQVFNVESYGASGTEAIDSSLGIASALAAAKAVHGTLFFPAGTYLTNSPLNFTGLAGVELEGPQTPAAGAGGGAGAAIVYTGQALSGTCPFEFTNSSYIHVSGLAFASNNPVACMALFGSAGAESFHIGLHNVFFKSGATVATVADFGAENLGFSGALTDIVYGAAGNAGVLISSDGGAGYGISSNFGYSFGPNSTTGYSFGPNIVFDGYGSAHALELDGRGDGIAFISSRGTFFQINQTGTGATAIYARGLVQDATFEAPRCESDVGSNPSYFFQAAAGANIENFDLERINQSGGCGIALYAPSGAAATISGMTLSGDAPAVSWNGNIYGLHLQSYSSLNIQVSGSLAQGSLDSFTGHGSDAVAAGALNMSINGWTNVVEYAQLGSVAASFTLPATGFQSNLYKASYNSAGCSFIWSEGFSAGAGSYGTISAVTSAVGYSGAQTLSCPTAGSYSSAQSVTATYTNTGGLFVVQQF